MGEPLNGAAGAVTADVLVADDESAFRSAFGQMLKNRGYRVAMATDPEEAIATVRRRRFDLVTLDLEWQFSDQTGIDILGRIRKIDPHLPVIIITGHATLETAKQATRLGAYDYLEKMTDREKTLLVVRNAVEAGRLKRVVQQAIDERSKNCEIVGLSRGIQEVREAIAQFGPRDVTVLIEGETGCGKELVARQLHLQSPRRSEPMVTVGGGELSRDLGQDVLYGHTPEAFTGSSRDRGGFVQAADRSTLFLDDISDLPPAMQPLFLRFLETGDYMKLGTDDRQSADVRVIAATNQNLAGLVEQGKFRADLYYRLKVATIAIPPLRERREDIPLLVNHFAAQQSTRLYGRDVSFHPDCHDLFLGREWPGNVRELRNAVIAILCRAANKEVVEPADVQRVLAEEAGGGGAPLMTLRDMESSFRRQCVVRALVAAGGNVTRAAETLGIDRSHLYRLIAEFDLGQYARQLNV